MNRAFRREVERQRRRGTSLPGCGSLGLSEIPLEDFTPALLRERLVEIENLSPTEIAAALETVRSVLKFGEEQGADCPLRSWQVMAIWWQAFGKKNGRAVSADALREWCEKVEVDPLDIVYSIERADIEDKDKYKPLTRWKGGFLPSELTVVRERLVRDGVLPEPTVDPVKVLSNPWQVWQRNTIRMWLSLFRFRRHGIIDSIISLVRPHMGGSVDEHAVSGHWRNQWFASERRHKRIWIDPYVTKGGE